MNAVKIVKDAYEKAKAARKGGVGKELIHRLEQIEAVRGLREENLALRKAMKG